MLYNKFKIEIGNQEYWVLKSVLAVECFVHKGTASLCFSVKWVYMSDVGCDEIVLVENINAELLNLSVDVILEVGDSPDFGVTIFNCGAKEFILKIF